MLICFKWQTDILSKMHFVIAEYSVLWIEGTTSYLCGYAYAAVDEKVV